MIKQQGRDHVIVLAGYPSNTPTGINKDFQRMRQPGDDSATQCKPQSIIAE